MSVRRTFLDNLREQTARETESPWIRLVRRQAATGSMIGGILALALVVPLIEDTLSRAAAPGAVLMLIGAVFGALSFYEDEVSTSRRRGAYAATCSIIGLGEFLIVQALT